MAESLLKDRLRDHAKAFDGLMSLIDAKTYYGEDTSNQWNKKKQTKQEAAAARRLKLDPDSELNRNAKEVMDERANNKRKLRELEKQENHESDADSVDESDADVVDESDSPERINGVVVEKPGEGLKRKKQQALESNKKQKVEPDAETKQDATIEPVDEKAKPSKKEAKREAKRERKAEKKAKKQEAARGDSNKDKAIETDGSGSGSHPEPDATEATPSPDAVAKVEQEDNPSNSASESEAQSPIFDTGDLPRALNEGSVEQASTTTSVSSAASLSEKPKHIKLPADTDAIRARVAAKIEALRAARKAPRPGSRQELLEERRKKAAHKAERKKEEKKQARQEAARLREEALASQSPSVMSPSVEQDDPASGNFSFGRVTFGDGSRLSHDLSHVLNQGKKKGPSDVKTALIKVQNQKKRLEAMDPEKRADIMEKEAWLTARRRAEGEKIHDSEARLKKAKSRKEAAQKKSRKEWQERSNGVLKAQKERQKKREDNIKKRKEDKLLGKAGKKAGGNKKKNGRRPGFEGSLGVGSGRQ